MSRIFVVSMDNCPGDSLCGLPAICALADEHEVVYLAFANRAILAMADLPPNVIDVLGNEPKWRTETMLTQTIGVAASIDYCHRRDIWHPTQHLIEWCGLPMPVDVPQPRLKVPDQPATPRYDVVLAPWCSATVRGMSGHQVRELCAAFHEEGLSVAIVGGADDMSRNLDFPKAQHISFAYNGYPFPDVVNVMRKAGCVVTVDSFPNRLAHAAGVANHIILSSRATPEQWHSHPGATLIRSMMLNEQALWLISDIVTAVKLARIAA